MFCVFHGQRGGDSRLKGDLGNRFLAMCRRILTKRPFDEKFLSTFSTEIDVVSISARCLASIGPAKVAPSAGALIQGASAATPSFDFASPLVPRTAERVVVRRTKAPSVENPRAMSGTLVNLATKVSEPFDFTELGDAREARPSGRANSKGAVAVLTPAAPASGVALSADRLGVPGRGMQPGLTLPAVRSSAPTAPTAAPAVVSPSTPVACKSRRREEEVKPVRFSTDLTAQVAKEGPGGRALLEIASAMGVLRGGGTSVRDIFHLLEGAQRSWWRIFRALVPLRWLRCALRMLRSWSGSMLRILRRWSA